MIEQLRDEEGKVFYEAEYWPDKNILCTKWAGDFMPVEQVKQGAMQMLAALKANPVPFCLNDTRNVVGVWDEANDWIAEFWMPEAIKLGLKKFAHVYPEELYSRLSAQFMQQNSEKVADPTVFEVKLFKNDQGQATEWLLSFAHLNFAS
ncbi:hypothetical protein BKI52_08135 [marine bacterium AO1-C]|nr:hypothetical protein BKI52_08135 [marine bacterium AO1-C]